MSFLVAFPGGEEPLWGDLGLNSLLSAQARQGAVLWFHPQMGSEGVHGLQLPHPSGIVEWKGCQASCRSIPEAVLKCRLWSPSKGSQDRLEFSALDFAPGAGHAAQV